MDNGSSMILSRRLLISLFALLIWGALSTGITYLLIGNNIAGIVFIILGFGIIILAIDGRITNRLDGKKSPKYTWYLIAIIFLLVAGNEASGLFSAQPTLSPNYIFEVVSITGIFLLICNSIYQIFLVVRSKE